MNGEQFGKIILSMEIVLRDKIDKLKEKHEEEVKKIFEDNFLHIMEKYDWDKFYEQILEGSMGEASENDCKRKVTKEFLYYMETEDSDIFDNSNIQNAAKLYLKEFFYI